MALQAKLQLRQSQSLVMTPQLLQSIRLLQFTHAELESFIDEEIERNPLLERAEPDAHDSDGGDERAADMGEAGGEEGWDSSAIASRLDTTLDNMFPDDPGRQDGLSPELSSQWKSAAGASSAAGGEGFDFEDVVAAGITLRAHVDEQIAFAFTDPTDKAIARSLADALDDSGYLRAEPDENAERFGVDADRVARVLSRCRTFDPPGLFARDLSECLALQLAARDRLDPAMKALIANLDLLAKRDFRALSRICGVGEEDLVDMLAEIRALDPRPGTAFSVASAQPIVADVIVRAAADGSWAVELNSDALPSVLVNQSYFTTVVRNANRQERQFLSDCLQSAGWLARSLDQRARTILKVAGEIVRQQDGFLAEGVRALKPLNLRMVAEAIGMHESTVSRVTANKYIMTPRGVFELRYFFTAAIASAEEDGASHSAEAVRHRIRSLVDAEDSEGVLSDDAIVDILKKNGIDIARRTVAKYREGMNIPSSVQRRREKRMLMRASA